MPCRTLADPAKGVLQDTANTLPPCGALAEPTLVRLTPHRAPENLPLHPFPEAVVEIVPGRMIYLGYGKYWRSDEIVGLLPIEEGRGPGRRTEVYVSTREDPVVASRSEQTILNAMAGVDEMSRPAEAIAALAGLVGELSDLPPVLQRMLKREGGFDVDFWVRRLGVLGDDGDRDEAGTQEDLFAEG